MRHGNQLKEVQSIGRHRLRLVFDDDFTAELDFSALVSGADWDLLRPLRDPDEFAGVRILNGALTFSTGYDVCPDVLRYWCEQGRICSVEEVDAAFGPKASVLRDKPR